MVESLLPGWLKRWLADRVTRLVASEWPRRPEAPGLRPIAPGRSAYCLRNRTEEGAETVALDPIQRLPIPPESLWYDYGSTTEEFLERGRADVETMRAILTESGRPLMPGEPVLELGCAAGRMTRWLADHARAGATVWGVDLSGPHIAWCRQHLSPPLRFALTTLQPHLPFEDRSFALAFAGSVFTHIDDLAETWLLELKRVLQPGGRLYITIHDRDTLNALAKTPDHWLWKTLTAHPDFEGFRNERFGMFTIGRGTDAQVFYDLNDLEARLKPDYRLKAVKPHAYGVQTATLWERI